MSREKLEKQIKELQADIALLQKKIDELPKINWFQPKERDVFYYVNLYGNANKKFYESTYDFDIVKSQLVFKTEEEAIKQSCINKATVRVLNRIAELNEGWLPNWENINESKHIIHYNFNENKLCVYRYTFAKHLDDRLYLKNNELSQQLINEMEDDLLLMLGVEK